MFCPKQKVLIADWLFVSSTHQFHVIDNLLRLDLYNFLRSVFSIDKDI